MEISSRVRRWAKAWWKIGILILMGAGGMLGVWHFSTYRSRRVLREIQALNGLARAEWSIDTGLAGMRFQFGPIHQVYLLGPQTDDGKLAILDDVPRLRILTLTNTKVTDEGLARLAKFRDLNCLYFGYVDHTKIIGKAGAKLDTPQLAGGKGLAALKDLPNLQVVGISGQGTSDADVEGLAQLKHLVLLGLDDTRVTDEGIARLKKALPKCVIRRR